MEVLRAFGDRPELRWISERDGGVVDAVNKGLRTARGEILAIQSSDDVYLPGAVEASVSALEKHPEVSFVYGDAEYVDAEGSVLGRTALLKWDLESYVRRDLFVIQASAFFRAEAATRAGLWDEEVAYAADSDYWLRLGVRGGAFKVERLLARYRYHDAQRDKAGGKPARDWERAVRKRQAEGMLDRRLRRAVDVGVHLTWHHYTPEFDWRSRTRRVYGAVLADPRAVFRRGFPKRELIPGREPIWAFLSRVKQAVGALVFDQPRFAWPLLLPLGATGGWERFANRGDAIEENPGGRGVELRAEWSTDLNLPRVIPAAGRRLMDAALEEWPISSERERPVRARAGSPDVSFVVGHRGESRVALLLATLSSLLGQELEVEVIVVEQAAEPVLPGRLPLGVRFIHQRPETAEAPYSRSAVFNRGAAEARGRLLVLHDNDILVPQAYASELSRLANEGFEAMRLMRFLFYLPEAATSVVVEGARDLRAALRSRRPEDVRQNCQGGTIAVTRDAYYRVGGHDEAFIGWGGEDNEFFDRCRLLRFHSWSYLPFVHLWHGPQSRGRVSPPAQQLLGERLRLPREHRARELAAGLAGFQAVPEGELR